MTIDEWIARAKETSENQCMDDLCREKFKQLAEWLEELKQYKEENQPETNLDHYKDEILEKCLWNLAIVKGKPKRCNCTNCSDCEFCKDQPVKCHKRATEWLKQPYIKPAYKLTQFEYDLLQSYSNIYKLRFKTMPFLNRMKEKGYFKSIDENVTIEDILANCEIKEED